jgi:hypothetical protein
VSIVRAILFLHSPGNGLRRAFGRTNHAAFAVIVIDMWIVFGVELDRGVRTIEVTKKAPLAFPQLDLGPFHAPTAGVA